MTVQLVPLNQINDNLYNPRSHYDNARIEELASSILQNGLLEVPKARNVAIDTYELAYGGYRFRAFKLLAKKDAEKWGSMPLDVIEISDMSMAIFALEENLKRNSMTPIDTARAIVKYLEIFPSVKEGDLAIKLSMSQGALSNMVRTMSLPKEILKYVDDETLTFTQARELCSLSDIDSTSDNSVQSKLVMIDAISLIGTNGIPSTVGGMKIAIHKAVKAVMVEGRFREILKDMPVANPPVFDTDEMKCFKCPKCMKTTDENGKAAYTCMSIKCWDLAQSAAIRKIAEAAEEEAAAKAKEDAIFEEAQLKREAELKARTEANISQEIKPAPAVDKPKPRIILIAADRLFDGDVFKSFSSREIYDGTEVRPPFEDGGELYLNVGEYAGIPGPIESKQAYRLVEREGYTGDIRDLHTPANETNDSWRAKLKADPLGAYNGVAVTYQGKQFVMVGPMVVFAPAPVEVILKPVTVTPAIDKATEIPVGATDEQGPTIGDEEPEEAKDGNEEETEEPENAKEENKVEEAAAKPAGNETVPPVQEAPVTPVPATEGTDELFTISLTLSVLVQNSSSMQKVEKEEQAWKLFENAVKNGEFTSDNITIQKE
ncbi:MAG: ParB/RepB/Spo0J family partition protein [Chloroflexota bacterium]